MSVTYSVLVIDRELVYQLYWEHVDRTKALTFFEDLTRTAFYDNDVVIALKRNENRPVGQGTVILRQYDKRSATLVDTEAGETIDKIRDARERLGLQPV